MSMFDVEEDCIPPPPSAGEEEEDCIPPSPPGGDEEDAFSGDEAEFSSLVAEAEDASKHLETVGEPLSKSEKERAEKNRLKALALKKARLMTHPYSKTGSKHVTQQQKLVDSGGGFFIEEGEEAESSKETCIIERPGPLLPDEQPHCTMCQERFSDSYLFRMFDHVVCDACRDMGRDGEHELITKTEAKTTFLIKDHDLEESEHGSALRFINRKNPHNPGGGEMKLYLRIQVEERAVQVWGSQDAVEKELEAREEKKIEAKAKKYKKQIKTLRMAARSSLYQKDLSSHTHQYKDEVYHEDKDEYSQTCETCGHINMYEKM